MSPIWRAAGCGAASAAGWPERKVAGASATPALTRGRARLARVVASAACRTVYSIVTGRLTMVERVSAISRSNLARSCSAAKVLGTAIVAAPLLKPTSVVARSQVSKLARETRRCKSASAACQTCWYLAAEPAPPPAAA